MTFRLLGIAAVMALALAVPAGAQVPRTLPYQGILTDPIGLPVADGAYGLTVRLYDAAAGGSLVFTEVHPAVPVVDGGFQVMLGSVTPLTLTFDRPLWLSLQAGADPELSPRVELSPAPTALGLALPFSGVASGATPAFTLRNTGGAALRTEGSVEIRSAGGVPSATISQFGSVGGQVAVRDEQNIPVVRQEPDASNTGGFLAIYRADAAFGLTMDGNSIGTEDPVLSLFGSARSTSLDMSSAGDPSVELPTGAINSVESFNEAGVAESYQNASIAVGNGVTTIGSRTITVPDDGYVIAMASGHCEMGHVNGTASRILYGVNDQNGVFASSQGVAGLPSEAPSGNSYRFPLPFTGVWSVTPGAHTFYLLAQKIGAANGIVWNDPTLTLVYVPTAYGTVTGNTAFGAPTPESSGLLEELDLAAEQAEAAAEADRRLLFEMEIVRAQLVALESQLGNLPAESPRK